MNTLEVTELIETLISTRDLCGNEREALRDWQAENRKLSPGEIIAVREAVESEWNKQQSAAGVKSPIHADERRAITKVLNRS